MPPSLALIRPRRAPPIAHRRSPASVDPVARRTFPLTRISLFAALAGSDEPKRVAAVDVLSRAYWGPVAALFEFRWNMPRADAEDLTQDFFAEALSKEWFHRYDPARGRFRTFIRTCVDRYASNARKAGQRLKRGGGIPDEPLDLAEADGASVPDETDARIHAEWVRGVLSVALEQFQVAAGDAGKRTQYAVFTAYDVDDPPDDRRPSYRDLAARFAIPETQVTNYLAWARREYRGHVLAALRSLAGNDAEFRDDARDLLGSRLP